MSEKFDLVEYKLALRVKEDFPEILQRIESLRKDLKRYSKYGVVINLFTELDKVGKKLEANIKYYDNVAKRKGKKNV